MPKRNPSLNYTVIVFVFACTTILNSCNHVSSTTNSGNYITDTSSPTGLSKPSYLGMFLEDAKCLYEKSAEYGLTPSLSGITSQEFLNMQLVVDKGLISLDEKLYEYAELKFGTYQLSDYIVEIPSYTFITPGGGGYSVTGSVSKDDKVIGEFIYEFRPRSWEMNSVTINRQTVGSLVFLSIFCNADLEISYFPATRGYSLVLTEK